MSVSGLRGRDIGLYYARLQAEPHYRAEERRESVGALSDEAAYVGGPSSRHHHHRGGYHQGRHQGNHRPRKELFLVACDLRSV